MPDTILDNEREEARCAANVYRGPNPDGDRHIDSPWGPTVDDMREEW